MASIARLIGLTSSISEPLLIGREVYHHSKYDCYSDMETAKFPNKVLLPFNHLYLPHPIHEKGKNDYIELLEKGENFLPHVGDISVQQRESSLLEKSITASYSQQHQYCSQAYFLSPLVLLFTFERASFCACACIHIFQVRLFLPQTLRLRQNEANHHHPRSHLPPSHKASFLKLSHINAFPLHALFPSRALEHRQLPPLHRYHGKNFTQKPNIPNRINNDTDISSTTNTYTTNINNDTDISSTTDSPTTIINDHKIDVENDEYNLTDIKNDNGDILTENNSHNDKMKLYNSGNDNNEYNLSNSGNDDYSTNTDNSNGELDNIKNDDNGTVTTIDNDSGNLTIDKHPDNHSQTTTTTNDNDVYNLNDSDTTHNHNSTVISSNPTSNYTTINNNNNSTSYNYTTIDNIDYDIDNGTHNENNGNDDIIIDDIAFDNGTEIGTETVDSNIVGGIDNIGDEVADVQVNRGGKGADVQLVGEDPEGKKGLRPMWIDEEGNLVLGDGE
ncbi:MAG: hypothetical protein M1820_009831 [Bogoriella megaspora]|nr:MAG: hypothetical protein M1820_009831 [Bogoriella megaspora]